MSGYELSVDEGMRMVRCRLLARLSDAEAATLAADLSRLSAEARRRWSVVRLLFENRHGALFDTVAMAALADRMRADFRTGDRTAILVASSLSKVVSKPSVTPGNELFISEKAALTWLGAWCQDAPAAHPLAGAA